MGNAGFSSAQAYYTAIAVDNKGTPYVAFQDVARSGKISVMKYDGSNWVTVGNPGFSFGRADYLSLKIDANGTPYVAFSDAGYGNYARVMLFNGAAHGSMSAV